VILLGAFSVASVIVAGLVKGATIVSARMVAMLLKEESAWEGHWVLALATLVSRALVARSQHALSAAPTMASVCTPRREVYANAMSSGQASLVMSLLIRLQPALRETAMTMVHAMLRMYANAIPATQGGTATRQTRLAPQRVAPVMEVLATEAPAFARRVSRVLLALCAFAKMVATIMDHAFLIDASVI